jgi:hypothetical protein
VATKSLSREGSEKMTKSPPNCLFAKIARQLLGKSHVVFLIYFNIMICSILLHPKVIHQPFNVQVMRILVCGFPCHAIESTITLEMTIEKPVN